MASCQLILLRPLIRLVLFLSIFVYIAPAYTQSTDEGIEDITDNFTTNEFQETVETDVRVFGSNLFTGSFAQQSFSSFNPNYHINIGDTLYIRVWGAVEFAGEQYVDAQGNIFIPQVGPIRVLGVPNRELNDVIENEVSRIYTNNVYIYTSLVAAQPVKVFVTGNVLKPGLYPGLSSDSILSYLDKAGGIDPLRGSFLDISLKRNGGEIVHVFNLYDFLISGDIKNLQLHEGDVLVVGSRKYVINFEGLIENPYQIEFTQQEIQLTEALDIVNPLPEATHISIERNTGVSREVEYMQLEEALKLNTTLMAGDRVSFVADKNQLSIGVIVEGEHLGQTQYILPYGSSIADLIPLLTPSNLSNMSSIRLYRKSLAAQQKLALVESLRSLERQVLTARNDTIAEAQLRSQEAELILKFVARARNIQPLGQVVLSNNEAAQNIIIENGDRIVVPAQSNLVSINGEVLFPNATIYQDDLSALDYINMSGGYSQRSKDARVIIRKPNGVTLELSDSQRKRSGNNLIAAGDEILVIPAVDTKTMQRTKDIIQVIYQLALSAGVVLSI